MTDRSSAVSGLLRAWGRGDDQARDDLLPLVYRELRRRAAGYLRQERSDHTLQPTALVPRSLSPPGRATTSRVAESRALLWRGSADDATNPRRSCASAPRGEASWGRVESHASMTRIGATQPRHCDLLALDEALTALTTGDPKLAQIVELRYFGGLSEQEVAEVLSISRSTVTREWQTARTWLYRRMTTLPEPSAQ